MQNCKFGKRGTLGELTGINLSFSVVSFSLALQTLTIRAIIKAVMVGCVVRSCWVWRMHFRSAIRCACGRKPCRGGKEDASGNASKVLHASEPLYYLGIYQSFSISYLARLHWILWVITLLFSPFQHGQLYSCSSVAPFR
ncbi:hypothetical protein K439DRAFT_746530 [Ramaria rubella]|nr:hypothetical protein K439DRAFT_746530 [Ramaria rubella]